MVRETLGPPVHLHFLEPSPLLRNLALPRLLRVRTLQPSFFRALPRGIAQTTAGFRHPETWQAGLFCGLLIICFPLESFLSSVELHLPSFFTSKPGDGEYVGW